MEKTAQIARDEQDLPAEEYPYLLLRFYDTYIYYIYTWNLLALSGGSPAPWKYFIRMTVTFENDNDIIMYALETVISHARRTQQIFVANCVWWLGSIIGLEDALVDYIHKLHGRTTVRKEHTTKEVSDHEVRITLKLQDSRIQPDKRKSISPVPRDIQEDLRRDQVLIECEEYLKDSRRLREIAALKATGRTLTGLINPTAISKKHLRKKDRYKTKLAEPPKKGFPDTAGINEAEIKRRKENDKCLRCAWPSDRKGAHRVKDCKRPITLDKGTASFAKAKSYQGRLPEEASEAEISSENSSDN
jgi:hypothetical protein